MNANPTAGRGAAPLRTDRPAEVRAALYRYISRLEAAEAEMERLATPRVPAEMEAYKAAFIDPEEEAEESLVAAVLEAHGLSPRRSHLDRPLAVAVDGFVVAIVQDSTGKVVPALVRPADLVAIEDAPAPVDAARDGDARPTAKAKDRGVDVTFTISESGAGRVADRRVRVRIMTWEQFQALPLDPRWASTRLDDGMVLAVLLDLDEGRTRFGCDEAFEDPDAQLVRELRAKVLDMLECDPDVDDIGMYVTGNGGGEFDVLYKGFLGYRIQVG
jgi:hypothetical protein